MDRCYPNPIAYMKTATDLFIRPRAAGRAIFSFDLGLGSKRSFFTNHAILNYSQKATWNWMNDPRICHGDHREGGVGE